MKITIKFFNRGIPQFVSPTIEWDGDMEWFYNEWIGGEDQDAGSFWDADIEAENNGIEETILVEWFNNIPLANHQTSIDALAKVFQAPELSDVSKWRKL